LGAAWHWSLRATSSSTGALLLVRLSLGIRSIPPFVGRLVSTYECYTLHGGPIDTASQHFRLVHTSADSDARSGTLSTAHGTVKTPVFMPVGSQATVKALTPDEIREIGFEIILSNSYHLYLRPGVETIRAAGGLHGFMRWDRAILTDSGGFQVFSLAPLRRIDEEGVTFRSHIDGSTHRLTPEAAVQIQEGLGADIAMVLDDVAPASADERRLREALDRTHHWAERCLRARTREEQLLFAIVQGGNDPVLRRESVGTLTALDFPGYAIGGLSVGESKQVMYSVLDATVPLLPSDRPRYLMGVGAPEDLVEAVHRGVDMFDCVLPTRVARNGAVYTRNGRRNIRHASFREAFGPLDTGCDCYACRTFSAAYVHHLFKCEELLAYRLATIHNLAFMHRLVLEMRSAIAEDRFGSFRKGFLEAYQVTDESVRLADKDRFRQRRRRDDEERQF
jgi:queuine tRNA-ribosyltransferase